MDRLEIKIKKIKPYAVIPSYAHPGDAGMDLYSAEDYLILGEQRQLISTGISTEFPEGHVALIWDKSGLAAKQGLTVLAGVIDHGYRGEWQVVLFNTTRSPYQIRRGDKVAQTLIQPVYNPIITEVTEVTELSDTSRGTGGFGSTGR
jgi:dUTP pyrophosphatase